MGVNGLMLGNCPHMMAVQGHSSDTLVLHRLLFALQDLHFQMYVMCSRGEDFQKRPSITEPGVGDPHNSAAPYFAANLCWSWDNGQSSTRWKLISCHSVENEELVIIIIIVVVVVVVLLLLLKSQRDPLNR